MIQCPVLASAVFYRPVSISRRRGFGINCTCQLELGSQSAMAAQRPRAALPESAENYSTTCQFYCVVITKSHWQTLTIPCLPWWCGGVNLRSAQTSSSLPSLSSILSRVHSLPEREIVFPTVHRRSQVVMYALLQRQRCWREIELLPRRLDLRWNLSVAPVSPL